MSAFGLANGFEKELVKIDTRIAGRGRYLPGRLSGAGFELNDPCR